MNEVFPCVLLEAATLTRVFPRDFEWWRKLLILAGED